MLVMSGWVLLGLVLLAVGSEILVKGAVRLADLLGLSPLVVGLTIISIGTSAPELAVGIAAGRNGNGSLVLGNIAGTNMVNLLFILGLGAFIKPIPLQLRLLRVELPLVVAAGLLLLFLARDAVLTPAEGALMLFCSLLYTVLMVRMAKGESSAIKVEFSEAFKKGPPQNRGSTLALHLAIFVFGVAVIVYGAEILVDGASGMARLLGVSESIIGLTIVAIGTSAPEIAMMIVATLRSERDVAVGNLIGSSIYNILVILGATCVFSPLLQFDQDLLLWDLPLMIGVSLVCIPIFMTGRMVSRREGAVLVLSYFIYLGWLISVRA